MNDLMDLLQSQVTGQMIDAFASNLGSNVKRNQTSKAVDGGIAILMNALAKNAKQSGGASALESALDKDHDGSILDDVAGFIGGTSNFSNTRAANGAGILKHVLRGKESGAIDMLAQMSGLNKNQSSQLLIKLAPIVLGMLGKQKRATGASAVDLSDLLSNVAGTVNKKADNASLITSFLDRDGDGNLRNEATQVGLNLLKGLFKRKR